MTENAAKGFKVPKIRRQECKDNLRPVDLTSRDAKEIVNTVKHSYLENNYVSQWQLKSVQFVENRDLEEQYRLKKAEMKEDGRHARDLVEQYAFLLFRDSAVVPGVVKGGLKSKYLPFNVLGDSKLGIYLCRNADVQLRLAEGWNSQTVTLIVFKITPGKFKVVAGQSGDELIEPTPNFDCHVSQNQPKPSDPVHLQLARSQVYLYEYTDECIPAEHPRHSLPYAVLVYEKLETSDRNPQQQTDSYSKRPALVSERSRSESGSNDSEQSQKSDAQSVGTVDPRQNRRDPRLLSSDPKAQAADPRLAYSDPRQQMNAETGLCVPRLTPGPPPSVDPRLQLSQGDPRLLQNASQGTTDSVYRPSFGPRDLEIGEQMQPHSPHLGSSLPPQPLSSLPAITLPPLTDPRLTRAEPRLDSRLQDPRLNRPDATDPRLNRPDATDPRLNRPDATDPRLNRPDATSAVPSYTETKRSSHKRSTANSDDLSCKSRKKLSLTDYKMKVGVQPVSKAESNAPATDQSPSPREGSSIYDSIRGPQHATQPIQTSYQPSSTPQSPFQPPPVAPVSYQQSPVSQPPFQHPPLWQPSMLQPLQTPQMVPPPLKVPQMVPPPSQMSQPALHTPPQMVPPPLQDPRISQPLLKDPRISQPIPGPQTQQSSYQFQTTFKPQYRAPMQLPDQAPPISSQSVEYPNPYLNSNLPQYYGTTMTNPPQANNAPRTEQKTEPRTDEKSEIPQDDIVDEPEDMAKTLNELPDPDDVSLSPIPMEFEEEDPVLAEAMRKLVEHSGNVSLFTEALKSLQESAEEMGDELTDPEFLVKKIAEKIDMLTRAQAEQSSLELDCMGDVDLRVRHDSKASFQSEIQTIKSPDIAEPTIMNAEALNYPSGVPIPFIPLENQNQEMAPNDLTKQVESPLAKAMQKTLAELEKFENTPSNQQNVVKAEILNYDKQSKKSEKKFQTNQKTPKRETIDLASIPIPPDIPKSHSMSDLKTEVVTVDNIPLPPSLHKDKEVQNTITHSQSESNIAAQDKEKEKPAISFNLKKRSNSPETVAEVFKSGDTEDIDGKKTSKFLEQLKVREFKREAFKPVVVKAEKSVSDDKKVVLKFGKISKDFGKSDAKKEETTVSGFGKIDKDFRKAEIKKEDEGKDSGFGKMDKDFRMTEIKKETQSYTPPQTNPGFVEMDQDFREAEMKKESSHKDIKIEVQTYSTSKSNINKPDIVLQDKYDSHAGREFKQEKDTLQSRDPRLRMQDNDERVKIQEAGSEQILMQDRDERILNKNSALKSANMIDPALLDRDERRSHSRSISPPSLNSAFMDRDERRGVQSNLNFVDPFGLDEEDRDDRIISRSQSGSPTPIKGKAAASVSAAQISIEKTLTSSASTGSFNTNDSQDSNDTGTLFDAYSIGKSSSGGAVSKTNKPSNKDVGPVENEFGDIDWRLAAAAEMGDVDLRASQSQSLSQRSTSSDVDLRQPPSAAPFGQAGPEQSQSFPTSGNFSTGVGNYYGASTTAYGQNFQQNQGIPSSVYGQNQGITQYTTTTASSINSYSTNKASYDSYSTYKTPVASYSTSAQYGGEYTTSGFQGNTYPDQYNYSTGGRFGDSYSTSGNAQQNNPHQPPGRMHNLIHNVDFSSLKNILAGVQKPGGTGTGSSPASKPQSMVAEPDSDEEENKPAFCTGLSFLKSKQPKLDLARAKYTGFAKLPDELIPLIPGAKALPSASVKSGFDSPKGSRFSGPRGPRFGFDQRDSGFDGMRPPFEAPLPSFCDPRGLYSNLDPSKQREVQPPSEVKTSDSQPFKFSEEIPERDITSVGSFWQDIDKKTSENREIPGLKASNNSDDDDAENDANESFYSPKKKTKNKEKKEETLSTPQSYQNAILESMELSALKVRSEDVLNSDMDETPVKDTKCAQSLFELNEKVNQSSEPKSSVKRGLDNEDEEKCRKLARTLISHNADDSDDEETALVIDLDHSSPMVKIDSQVESHKDKKSGQHEESQPSEMEKVLTIDLTQDDGRETPVMDEKGDDSSTDEESDDEEEEILQDEEVVPAKSKNDMQSLIEKSRKNMVIRLKGETKIVNPKTGKAYNESLFGSAIQVLGQKPPKPKPVLEQKPISVLHRSGIKRVPSPANVPPTPLQQIHPIHGIIPIGGVPNPAGSSSRSQFRSPSPVGQPHMSSISSIVSGATGFRSTSPVNQISTVGQVQRPVQEYIHPYTGQKITYGAQSTPQPVTVLGQPQLPQHSVGFAGLPGVPLPNLAPPPMSNIRSTYMVASTASNIPEGQPQFRMQSPRLTSVSGQPLQQQYQGMAIQSLGANVASPLTSPSIKTERKSSTDVFDWFSDKFQKRDQDSRAEFSGSSNNVTIKTEPYYEFSSNSAIKIIKTEPEYATQGRRDIKMEVETDALGRKRGNESDNPTFDSKKLKTEQPSGAGGQVENMAKVLDCHSIETLSKVKDVLKNTLANLNASSSASDTEAAATRAAVDPDALSDLEEGEISDDLQDDTPESSPTKHQSDSFRRVVVQDRNYSNIQVLGARPNYPGSVSRMQTYESAAMDSPKRNVNIRSGNPTGHNPPPGKKHKAAADWADLLQNPDTRIVERMKATKIESWSLDNMNSDVDASSLFSKSAASISKTKQKIVARSQVKTLGDWLKVELETDNILPLQNIIPYSFSTDLSIIPKQRRRKIRLKVKNAIEQEGNKKFKNETKAEPAKPATEQYTQVIVRPVISPNYSPEVPSEQIEKELELLNKTLRVLNESRKEFVTNPEAIERGRGTPNSSGVKQGSSEELKLLVAMATVESEMKTLIQRTNFFGYPHRRVPNGLLLESELSTFKSDNEDVFLILMMPISTKPYKRLLQMKEHLENKYLEMESAKSEVIKEKIKNNITNLHMQRQGLFRSFTGFLNKKRITKIQEQTDKYTLVYDYYKCQNPPVSDSMLKFIRTTQMDLRQHLILAKQYLAIEEKKLEI